MKIAIIRRECGNSWGGAERYCAQIVKTLSEFGHEVTLIARKKESSCAEVNFIPIKYIARGSILKNCLFFVKVRRLLLQTGFDVVYGLSRVYPVDVFRITDPLHAARIQERYQNEFFRRLTALSIRHRLLLYLERKLILDPQVRIVCMSKLVVSQISQHYGLNPSSSRLSVIYNGVDLQQFNPTARKAGKELRQKLGLQHKTTLLFAGADARRKGFQTLIKAMSSLQHGDMYLLVMGLSKKKIPFPLPSNIEDRLIFTGWVGNPAVYYGCADLLVLPTKNDPFGNVVLESLACGTPVLTTTAAGASEIVEPGKTGFIMADPRSHDELREKLEDYLSFPKSKRVTMGEEAAHQATQYTWARHGEMLLQVLEDFAG
jgi:UDP-glucose:(heptosyl)LPS alpha-1,3-glucosyltransferase